MYKLVILITMYVCMYVCIYIYIYVYIIVPVIYTYRGAAPPRPAARREQLNK